MLTAASTAPCAAGVIRDDRADADYRNYATQPQFAPVGSYSTGSLFGSFTLVAPQWALTAAHVVDTDGDGLVSDELISNDVLRLGAGSVERGVKRLVVPLGVNGNRGWNGNINDGFDIALVELDEPVTTIAPAKLYTSFQELGRTVTQVGFGQSGKGTTGATGGSGTKRAGDNVVDQLHSFSNGATALRWDFDEPAPRTSPNFSGSSIPLDMEYLIAPGDSGGGSFIFEDDDWYLAGVHSGTYDLYNYPGASTLNTSTYGDGALITRVAAYQQFILTNIPDLALAMPEPSNLAVVLVAGLTLARRRRRGKAGE
jgi:hypothetical protein